MANMKDENDSYLKPGMKDEKEPKGVTHGRPATGGSAQLQRDLKTNKPMNKGMGPMYEAGSKSELARQARKIALKKFGQKSKQYRTTPSIPDSIIKKKKVVDYGYAQTPKGSAFDKNQQKLYKAMEAINKKPAETIKKRMGK